MVFDFSKLKGLIAENNMTAETLASKIGITQYTFSKKINNKVAFTSDEIYAMIQALNVDDNSVRDVFFKPKTLGN